jgi:2-(1,2-epoxy-1,2-dihydrophenyl)acetyl-CoA isomerase
MSVSTMSFSTIRLTKAGRVATLTLARPEKLNALTATMHAELRAALDGAEADDEVRVVVLTGEGRAFSSGQDLTEELPRDKDGQVDLGGPLARDYNPLVRRLAHYPKVTVAALNGPAVGASMNIALCCDVVVAARSAYFQEAFAQIGLIPDAGGTWLLPRLVGPTRALALMLTADRVPAEEAERLGLVYKVFDDAAFTDGVAALAARLAEGPALAYRLMKRAVAEGVANSFDAQLAVEAELQQKAGVSADFAEGIRAFKERRPPRFEGR